MYKVIGKYINGVEISGFGVEDEEGKFLKIKFSDFIALVKRGVVEGFKYINIEGQEYVLPKNRLMSQLPTLNKEQYEIEDRVFDSEGKVIGYIVITDEGKRLKLSKAKIWDLAFEGLVKNVRVGYDKREGERLRRLIVVGE